jgi:hypothetical protein
MRITPRKPRKRAKFRISFVALFFIASFVICFFAYMKNDNDFVFPGSGGEAPAGSDREAPAGNDGEAPDGSDDGEAPAGSGGIVPESEKKELSYLSDAFFIGSGELGGLSGFAWVKPDRIITDNMLKTSNIGSLVLGFNGKNQTTVEALASVSPKSLYILLRPEETPDTASLKAYIEKVREVSEDTEIYIISAFPPKEDSGVTPNETDAFNSALLKFAEENDIKYLDINLSLTDNAGRLKKEYASDGGISGAGAEFFANYILSHT